MIDQGAPQALRRHSSLPHTAPSIPDVFPSIEFQMSFPRTNSSLADFLVSFSSVHGYRSWSGSAGSIFIQTLCNHIFRAAERFDVEPEEIHHILLRVNRNISQECEIEDEGIAYRNRQAAGWNLDPSAKLTVKQMPQFSSTLCKNLYLPPILK